MDHSDTGTLNLAWAAALIDGLAACGVRHAVVSPGSRSTPLTLACLRHAGLATHVVVDERCAAFFALGLAKASGAPVAVVATSGTAVANWHPAVAEADMGRVPLILLSADRPPEAHDCGANQTMSQHALFGPALRAFHALPPPQAADAPRNWLGSLAARAVQQSRWPLPGPVQLNVALREPLLPPDAAAAAVPPSLAPATVAVLPRFVPDTPALAALAARMSGRPGVIVCGAEPMPAAAIARLAAAFDAPVLADPLSGLRFGPHDRSRVMARADVVLRAAMAPQAGMAPDWVLRFGAFPVSKPLATWLAGLAAEQVVVSGDPRWPDPARAAAVMIHGDLELTADALTAAAHRATAAAPWLARWHAAEAQAQALAESGSGRAPAEAAVVRAVIDALPDGALLFVGNSMAVRDLDAFSGTSAKRITVLANRGVSGIDGAVSTFLGAAASGRYTAAVALMGDLTFLHDVGGLAQGGADAVICVLDNGGGGIFDHLAPAALPEYERAWLTPPRADLAAAAAIWGHAHARVAPDAFAPALAAALAQPGTAIVQIAVDRADSTARHRALWSAAASLPETLP